MPPTPIIERPYGQWEYVPSNIATDRAMVEVFTTRLQHRLLAYCAEHHLHVVGDVTFQWRRADQRFDWQWSTRNLDLVMAEVRAQGLPPDKREPPNWRARWRSWRADREDRRRDRFNDRQARKAAKHRINYPDPFPDAVGVVYDMEPYANVPVEPWSDTTGD
jgi:hypothetical protein